MNVKMKVVQGRPAGKFLVFVPGDYFFGRGHECHVRPNSDWVSRQHCLLRVTPSSATIRDLGSRNGTLVNGSLIRREQELTEGDHIQIGPLVLEVFFQAPAELITVDTIQQEMGEAVSGEGDSKHLSDAATWTDFRFPAFEETAEPAPAPKPQQITTDR